MPISKNQVERLQFIHQLLLNDGKYSSEELLKKIENGFGQKITKRTLVNDMNYMRSKGAPIPNRAKKYCYTEPYSLFDILEEDDTLLLKEFQGIVNKLSNLNKIDKLLGKNLSLHLADNGKKTVFFDWQEDLLKNFELLPKCLEFIQQKKVLNIKFQDFDKPLVEGNLHPYLLKEYNGRWYICGLWESEYEKTGQKKIYVFALDRILSILPVLKPKITFIPEEPWFNAEAFFNKMIGVTNNEGNQKAQNILVRVYGLSAHYMLGKKIHHSQQVAIQTSEYTDFQFHLIDNYEFRSKILALGSNAEVLKPNELRKSFAEITAIMRERYLE